MTLVTEESYKALKALLEDTEADLVRSAEAGKELCEQLSLAQGERDRLLQERHALKQALDHKQSIEIAFQDEIEAAKSSLEKAEQQAKENIARLTSDHEAKEKVWRAKEQNYEAKIEDLESKLDLIKKQKAAVEVELAQAEAAANSKNVSIVSNDGSALLEEELLVANQKNAQLTAQNIELMETNEELKLQVDSLRTNVVELKETLEEKDNELAELMPVLNQNNEFNFEEETDSNDQPLSKGNSLFSEVDDRRLLVEDQLKKYKNRCEELQKICESKNRLAAKLRGQNATLLTMAAGDSDTSNARRRLEDLLNTERSKCLALQQRVAELESGTVAMVGPIVPSKRRETIMPVVKVDDQASIELRNQQIRQYLQTEENLQKAHREINTLERNQSRLKAENYHLKMRIQEMNDKREISLSQGSLSRAKPVEKEEKVKEMIIFESESDKKTVLTEKNDNIKEEIEDGVFHEFKLEPKEEEMKTEKVDKKSRQSIMPRKVVSFCDDAKDENESSAKKPKRKVRENRTIDADVEAEKLNQQCTQQ